MNEETTSDELRTTNEPESAGGRIWERVALHEMRSPLFVISFLPDANGPDELTATTNGIEYKSRGTFVRIAGELR